MAAEHTSAVTHKRCTKCLKYKRVPEDYVMRKRTLKSGEVRKYAAGECKECGALRREKWKQDYIAEHGLEAWRDLQRHYSRKRDKEARKKYNREWWRMTHGKGTRVWKRYEHEKDGGHKYPRVPSRQLRWFWDTEMTEQQKALVRSNENFYRALRRAMYDQKNVELRAVDELGVMIGRVELISYLYPGE